MKCMKLYDDYKRKQKSIKTTFPENVIEIGPDVFA